MDWEIDILCRVTALTKAVCHTSKICKTWQISMEAALLLAACPRNLCLAAPTPRHTCSLPWLVLHCQQCSGKTAKGLILRLGCMLTAPQCCVQAAGACLACALRRPFALHILHWLPKADNREEFRRVLSKPLQI